MKRLWVVGILILAFCGLADSIYIAQHEASGTPLLCNIQNFSNCNVVAASQYSRLFGVPLADYGIMFYSVLFILAALELVIFDRLVRRLLQAASIVGLVSSLYFVFVQMFFIGAFCIYCSVSGLITLLVFILASLLEPIRRVPSAIPPPPHLRMPPTAS